MLLRVLLIGFSYLLGSLSSAIIVCRMGGYPDPRSLGSRNPGATRDLLKGLLPLAFGHWLDVADSTLAAMGVAAFLGHLYPVFFGFQGGKGVATFIGVLWGLAWQAGLAFMGLWLAVAGLFRYSSLAALVAAALSPVAMALVHPSPSYLVAVTAMAAVILWRHRSNIRNLLAGTERKIGALRE
jgi:glycerol-3-phosphate acyltransferase PlsY